MDRKGIEVTRDLLVILMNHLIWIAGAVAVLGLFHKETTQLWLWILLGFVPVVLYFSRIRIQNFFLFFALHLLLLTGSFWIHTD